MEFNNPSEIVKDLTFGSEATSKIMSGVNKLTNAVKSTMGASGKCVIYEDALGRPVITKDGVTVAESVVLRDPVENIGATLIKEAARNTVREAGDGTTTATVLAHALLTELNKIDYGKESLRNVKNGVEACAKEITNYLEDRSIPVEADMLQQVAYISCNNDRELGDKISEAFNRVGKDGVVLMEESDTNETYVEFVEGTQFDSGLKSPHLVTDKDKHTAVLDNPYVLIVSSPIPNIRKIQSVLEHVVKEKRSLLIIADVEQQPYQTLLANKVKGNIKVNIIDLPGFGPTKQETIEDLAILTGATVINEELGDDLDLIDPAVLGEAVKSVTDSKNTVLQVEADRDLLEERIENLRERIATETNGYIKGKLEQRLSMLTGKVGLIYVGADSQVELKEKKDRVEDAIYATQAALKEGIVPGGGATLLHASQSIKSLNSGYKALLTAIRAPFNTIMDNAHIVLTEPVGNPDMGIDAATGEKVNMVEAGIIDPVLVTKTALKNAVSVANTIMSADAIISNQRVYESSK
jgi:chaperonin GroEL